MKKLILLCALSHLNCFAGEWMPIDSYINAADNLKGVEKILNNFPEIQNTHNIKAEDVRNMYVSIIYLAYQGETTCSDSDPRLEYEHFSYSVCLKSVIGPCISHYDDFKTDEDPCLKPKVASF